MGERIIHLPGDRARFALLLAVLIWAPIPLGSYDRWAMLVLAGLLCALGTWHLITLAMSGRRPGPVTRASTLPLGLLLTVAVWQVIQVYTVSRNPFDTSQFALLSFGYFAAALLITELVHSRERVTTMLWTLLAAAVFQATFAVTRVLSGEMTVLGFDLPRTPTASGTFFNRNHFAAYMVITLSLGIGLMVAQLGDPARSWRDLLRNFLDTIVSGKAGLRLLLIVLVIALIMTRSRMGNMGFFLSLTGTAVLWAIISRRLSRGFVIFLASIIVIDLVLIGTIFGVDQVAERIGDTMAPDATPDARVFFNEVLLPMMREFWVFGTGGGSFWTVFPAFRSEEIFVGLRNAHNDYAQVVIELGLIGAVCLGGFWLICVRGSLGLLQSRDKWFRGMAFGGIMLASYLALHASVEFNLYIPGVAVHIVAALTLLGVVVPALRKTRRRRRSRRSDSDDSD
ncbi:MAG: O-antigen ligase family protein [Gammaproteobacteria bacterium]|nr:O-antigen ligase family protein [Gammaproteobacteria bacterium]